MLALIALALVTAIGLRIATTRPRSADPETIRVDDIVRRRVVESIVGGAGVAVGLIGFAGYKMIPRKGAWRR